jgi:type IV pilus assembly protein PilX
MRSPQRQNGMTLIVGLVLLVMLMMISMIGFRNTTLSERMTGNVLDRNFSLQAAESSGKEALQVIESGGFVAGTLGHYSTPFAGGGTANFWTQGAGASVAVALCPTTTPFSWTSCSASVATPYASNFASAQYVIELLDTESYGGSGGTTVTTYRVTSRSTGGSGNSDVVLQVLYTTSAVTP